MTHIILSHMTANITELKKQPMATVNSAKGEPLAILNRNEPVFYCVPAKKFEAMINALEDIHWMKTIKEREREKEINVNIDDL